MNHIDRIVITTGEETKADYSFDFGSKDERLINYIKAETRDCSLCGAQVCQGHVVEYKLNYMYVYQTFVTAFKRYLNSLKVEIVVRDFDQILVYGSTGVNYTYDFETNILKAMHKHGDDTVVDLEWFVNAIAKTHKEVFRFVSKRVLISPAKLRESFQKRSPETKILMDIINFVPNADKVTATPHKHVYALTHKKAAKSQELIDATTFNQLPNKKGLWRLHVLVSYVTNNGRTVATAAESECPYGSCRIPASFAHMVTEDFYDRRLDQNIKFIYDEAAKRYVTYEGDELAQGHRIYRTIVDGDVVVLNRQPTLHWRSLMSHKVKLSPEDLTLRLHRCCTSAYAADFDGDEMNVHMPISIRANVETRLLLNSKLALFDSGRVYVGPLFHELGVLRIISEHYPHLVARFLPKTFNYNARGIVIRNGELISGLLDSNNIGMKVGSAFHKLQYYGEIEMSEILTKMCEVCDEVMHKHPLTLTPEFLDTMIVSGCRGSEKNRGFMTEKLGVQYLGGDIITLTSKFPVIIPGHELLEIKSCYQSGLTPEEVILQSMPTRKSLVDAKLNIAKAGSMMNKLSSVLSGTSVDSNGNIRYLGIIIASGQSLSYKYYSSEFHTYIDLEMLIHDILGERASNVPKPKRTKLKPYVLEIPHVIKCDLRSTFVIEERGLPEMQSHEAQYGRAGYS